jgi:pSer/pThr/pTyr-binding forkhead associated (FHA) protein
VIPCPADGTVDHAAATGEYCDICGLRLRSGAQAEPPPAVSVETCARCGAVREGRFCEVCGYDSALGPPPEVVEGAESPQDAAPSPAPQPAWTAVVRADRSWFDEVRRREGPDAGTLRFPEFSTERRFVLDGPQLAIGRRSRSRGVTPEIDLSAPPVDPGVSTLHALLVGRSDGGWEVVDLESTNGTIVGDRPEPIPPNTPVPLADGDVVKLGAWTTITLVVHPQPG